MGALVLMTVVSSTAGAQDHQALTSHHDEYRNPSGALVRVVREATERYKDVSVAETDDYHLMFGCVSGPDAGAMGLHFVNLDRVFDGGELDATRPEIVIYEPLPNGRLRLIGADYLVIAKDWDDKHPGAPPQIMGQLLHLFESPNRFGLPPFYTLHVWAWKDNPTGTFVNWHSKVSCNAFSGQN
jgi:hypothetical protein